MCNYKFVHLLLALLLEGSEFGDHLLDEEGIDLIVSAVIVDAFDLDVGGNTALK
jgi:hypothetical protein